jgi:hypothetical protein
MCNKGLFIVEKSAVIWLISSSVIYNYVINV